MYNLLVRFCCESFRHDVTQIVLATDMHETDDARSDAFPDELVADCLVLLLQHARRYRGAEDDGQVVA
jgi:hypothetical protein